MPSKLKYGLKTSQSDRTYSTHKKSSQNELIKNLKKQHKISVLKRKQSQPFSHSSKSCKVESLGHGGRRHRLGQLVQVDDGRDGRPAVRALERRLAELKLGHHVDAVAEGQWVAEFDGP